MNWLFHPFSNSPDFFSWYMILPNIIAHILMPLVSFGFFCRCLMPKPKQRFGWRPAFLYLLLRAGSCLPAFILSPSGTTRLLAEICLLALFGLFVKPAAEIIPEKPIPKPKSYPGFLLPFFSPGIFIRALTLSALTVSLNHVCTGFLQWASYLAFGFLLKQKPFSLLIYLSDTLRELFGVLLFLVFAMLILDHFSQSIKAGIQSAFPLLMLPLLFIALVEQTIQDTIYGDTIITNRQSEIIFPVINHREILFLHLFACACLFLTLAAYRDVISSLYARQAVRQLEQQAREQEIYIRESRMRYEKTRAFRHDTKNHLIVLAQLLKNHQNTQAYDYLTHLEDSLTQLSCPVQTGNDAVDALLGSKFFIAGQNHIATRCELAIPDKSGIPDYDWCILLANATDNAIAACGQIPKETRYLHIQGSRKGNFYLLLVENSCDPAVTVLPEDGIGLSNIRAVTEKYHGSVHKTLSSGVYRLELLLILPSIKTNNFHT